MVPATDPRRWWALTALCLAVFMVAVYGTVLSLATPSIVADLAPSASQILWIGDIYAFVLAGLLVTMGSLGDRIGRKRLLLIGGTAFAVLSVPAAMADSAGQLILLRALLGVAGATLMPATLALLRTTFVVATERTFAVGVWSAASAAGAAAGPLLGGLLLNSYWWGSVFLLNLPMMALVIGIGLPSLRESKDPNPGPFDPLSALLSLVGILGVVFALKELATGGSPVTMLPLALAAGLVLLWFVRRQLALPHPLIDVRLFRNGPFTGAVVAMMLAVFGLAGAIFFFSQFLQFVVGLTPLQAGLFELPATAAALVGSLLAGRLLRRVGRGPATAGALLAIAVGMLAVAVLLDRPSVLWFAVPLILIGAGDGIAIAVTSDTVLAVAPRDRVGAASAVSETGYQLGAALGIALLGSVLTMAYQAGLRQPVEGVDAAVAQAARQSPGNAFESAAGLPDQVAVALLDSVAAAFQQALSLTVVLGAVILALGAVLSWWLLPRRGQELAEFSTTKAGSSSRADGDDGR